MYHFFTPSPWRVHLVPPATLPDVVKREVTPAIIKKQIKLQYMYGAVVFPLPPPSQYYTRHVGPLYYITIAS